MWAYLYRVTPQEYTRGLGYNVPWLNRFSLRKAILKAPSRKQYVRPLFSAGYNLQALIYTKDVQVDTPETNPFLKN